MENLEDGYAYFTPLKGEELPSDLADYLIAPKEGVIDSNHVKYAQTGTVLKSVLCPWIIHADLI